MTALEMLTAALADKKVMLLTQEAADPDIVLRVSFPNPVVNLLPMTGREGSTSQSLTVPFVTGKTYTVSLDVASPSTGRFELFTRTAKGKTSAVKKVGPGPLNHVFIPSGSTVGLFFDTKGGASWSKASVIETAPVVEPPPVEPPPVEPPPVEPPPVEPPPVIVDPPPTVEPEPAPVPETPPPPPVVVPPPATFRRPLLGVNIAGGEFGGSSIAENTAYMYPRDKDVDYFIAARMEVLRIPFKWHRIHRKYTDDTLKGSDLEDVIRISKRAIAKGVIPWLDLHSYARWDKLLIGGVNCPVDWLAKTWRLINEALIAAGIDTSMVWYGIMNEPNGINGEIWHDAMLLACQAIRDSGGKGRILEPGTAWTGAHSWTSSGNAERFERRPFRDPLNNHSIEVHQYLDADSSGTSPTVVPGKGEKVLKPFTAWCRRMGMTAVLGEFAWAETPEAAVEGRALIQHMIDNPDVWVGAAYWAGGSWWGKDYPFDIGEGDPNDQLRLMQSFL